MSLVLSHHPVLKQQASTANSPLPQLVRLEYCVVYRIYLCLLNKVDFKKQFGIQYEILYQLLF